MKTYSFDVILDAVTELTDDMADALFEAGCDDAGVGSCEGVVTVHFDREAESLGTRSGRPSRTSSGRATGWPGSRHAMTSTRHEYRGYVFTIEPGYVVDFPDFPTIITGGSTPAEAYASACEALDHMLESLEDLAMTIPAPKYRPSERP
jgi:predicted RNase H-like HicB family nuclease